MGVVSLITIHSNFNSSNHFYHCFSSQPSDSTISTKYPRVIISELSADKLTANGECSNILRGGQSLFRRQFPEIEPGIFDGTLPHATAVPSQQNRGFHVYSNNKALPRTSLRRRRSACSQPDSYAVSLSF
jgi:hypothetical protein